MTKKKSLRIIVSLTLIVVMCCGLMVSSNAAISSTWKSRMQTWGTCNNGTYSTQARVVQRFLICFRDYTAELVLDIGGVDGYYGQKTYEAVKLFQRAVGIGVDGGVGQETWGAMADAMYQTTGMVSSTVRMAVHDYYSGAGVSGNVVDCALYSGTKYWHYPFGTDGNRQSVYFVKTY